MWQQEVKDGDTCEKNFGGCIRTMWKLTLMVRETRVTGWCQVLRLGVWGDEELCAEIRNTEKRAPLG